MSFLSQPTSIVQSLFGTKRQIADFTGFITTTEETTNKLTITKQPVQQGAMIGDHSFAEPVSFSCQIFYSANNGKSLKETYDKLLKLQNSRVPFEIITPKRTYSSMLMSALTQTTDKTTENCLSIRFSFEEIIIVSVNTVQVSRSAQKNPGNTGKTEAVGKKSIGVTVKEAGQALFSGGTP